jgi:hypothetical protein
MDVQCHGVRRHLFNLLSAVSLVLCVATVVLWVRSYWLYDEFCVRAFSQKQASSTLWGHDAVTIVEGQIDFWRRVSSLRLATLPAGFHESGLIHPEFRDIGFETPSILGFNYLHGKLQSRAGPYSEENWQIGIPFWFLTAMFAFVPVMRTRRRWIRLGCKPPGFCAVCGYDLRATPERCPECGTAVKKERSGGRSQRSEVRKRGAVRASLASDL